MYDAADHRNDNKPDGVSFWSQKKAARIRRLWDPGGWFQPEFSVDRWRIVAPSVDF